MDSSTFIGSGVGFGLAVLVVLARWWFSRSTSGFANVVKSIMAAVDKIDASDDVKHELGKDLLDLFQQYLKPEDPATTIKAHVEDALSAALKKLGLPHSPSPIPPVASPAS